MKNRKDYDENILRNTAGRAVLPIKRSVTDSLVGGGKRRRGYEQARVLY